MLNSTSIHLGQQSFEIYPDDDEEPSICGSIRGTTTGSIHFIGQEKVGNQVHTLIDQEYPFSCSPQEVVPFNFTVPNDLPPSIQLENGDGVSYAVQVREKDQVVATEPVRLHVNTSCDHDDKLFWGIIENQWQYEIEFPSVYYFNNQQDNASQACIRFKSLEGQQKKLSDCCLVGIQVIQSIQRKGYDTEYQVIAMETRLLTDLNQTWADPYLLTFNLSQNEETRLLPTTWTERIEIQHDIKFTLAFTDPLNNLNFDFPITCIEESSSNTSSIASSNSSVVTTFDFSTTSSTLQKQDSTVFLSNIIA